MQPRRILKEPPIAPGWRQARGVDGPRHDAYAPTAKMADPAVCPTCGAVWRKGRWTWAARPSGAREAPCPACRRIRDRYPAGLLRLEGDFGDRKQEIVNRVRNVEAAEKARHPLERIMKLAEERGGISIETTGIHVARRIAEALRRTWHEHVEIQYQKEQDLVRVTWNHGPPPAPARTDGRAPRKRARRK